MGLPCVTTRTPSFAFIVHPRNHEDIFRVSALSLLRDLSTSDVDFLARVSALRPLIIGELLFGFSPFRGDLISIACLPPDVPTARGRREIVRAAQMAADR